MASSTTLELSNHAATTVVADQLPQPPFTDAAEPRVRVVYIDDGIRWVTIAYQIFPNNAKKNIKFAASIFRKEEGEKVVFVRKQQSHTARERLNIRPLWTEFAIPERLENGRYDKDFYHCLQQHLRKEIHKRGTGSKQRLRKAEIKTMLSPASSEARTITVPVFQRQSVQARGSSSPPVYQGRQEAIASV